MNILSHRGLGFTQEENSLEAFKEALAQGFGLEIDVRLGLDGHVVVSHDPPQDDALLLVDVVEELFLGTSETIAVHLKEQDEQVWRPVCEAFVGQGNIFLFDPTIETAEKIKQSFPEIQLAFSVGEAGMAPTVYTIDQVLELSTCDMIWWDEWEKAGDIYNIEQFKRIKEKGKSIYAISPELHKVTTPAHEHCDEPEKTWDTIINLGVDGVCTDLPEKLRKMTKKV